MGMTLHSPVKTFHQLLYTPKLWIIKYLRITHSHFSGVADNGGSGCISVVDADARKEGHSPDILKWPYRRGIASSVSCSEQLLGRVPGVISPFNTACFRALRVLFARRGELGSRPIGSEQNPGKAAGKRARGLLA